MTHPTSGGETHGSSRRRLGGVPAPPTLPSRARVVVVGGGVIGCSVAYHLGHLGWDDVVLLERDRLTSGTTWHAAGLMVTFGSTSETSTEMRKYTRDLYARLEQETGLATGFKACGFIEVAIDEGRLEEYRRVSTFNRYCGIDVQEISAAEVAELFPLARTDDILAGFYVAGDGRVNPVDVTMSLAKGARQQGVTVIEGVPVTAFRQRGGAVTGVCTPFGDIEAEYVVNCAGMWARQLGATAGVTIPLQAAEHYYLLTEPIPGVTPESVPVIEDGEAYGYYREEGGGLLVGMFEPVAKAWALDGTPRDSAFAVLPPDWDRMSPQERGALASEQRRINKPDAEAKQHMSELEASRQRWSKRFDRLLSRAEKYGLAAIPLPQNWQSAVSQENTDAFLTELKSSQ
jgi:4-methylaminobutanoate oxidase (formaldehyde-forming)